MAPRGSPPGAALRSSYGSGSKRRVARRYSRVEAGQLVDATPSASWYQLVQPPIDHTVRASRAVHRAVYARCSSARTSRLVIPRERIRRSASITYAHLALLLEHLGVVPGRAAGATEAEQVREVRDGDAAVGVRAPVPVLGQGAPVAAAQDWVGDGGTVTLNPVPKMITSAGCSRPSVVTTESGRHLADTAVDHRHVGRRHGGVPVVRHEDPLAAQLPVRGQPPAQRRGRAPGGAGGAGRPRSRSAAPSATP